MSPSPTLTSSSSSTNSTREGISSAKVTPLLQLKDYLEKLEADNGVLRSENAHLQKELKEKLLGNVLDNLFRAFEKTFAAMSVAENKQCRCSEHLALNLRQMITEMVQSKVIGSSIEAPDSSPSISAFLPKSVEAPLGHLKSTNFDLPKAIDFSATSAFRKVDKQHKNSQEQISLPPLIPPPPLPKAENLSKKIKNKFEPKSSDEEEDEVEVVKLDDENFPNSTVFKCEWPSCSQLFSSENILIQHRRACHIRKSTYLCQYCSARMLSREELEHHLERCELHSNGYSSSRSIRKSSYSSSCGSGVSDFISSEIDSPEVRQEKSKDLMVEPESRANELSKLNPSHHPFSSAITLSMLAQQHQNYQAYFYQQQCLPQATQQSSTSASNVGKPPVFSQSPTSSLTTFPLPASSVLSSTPSTFSNKFHFSPSPGIVNDGAFYPSQSPSSSISHRPYSHLDKQATSSHFTEPFSALAALATAIPTSSAPVNTSSSALANTTFSSSSSTELHSATSSGEHKPKLSTPENVHHLSPQKKTRYSGVGRYRCPWPDCGYTPHFLRDLRRHMFKHTGDKKHRCEVPGCDFVSVWKTSLQQHQKKKHPNFCTVSSSSSNNNHLYGGNSRNGNGLFTINSPSINLF